MPSIPGGSEYDKGSRAAAAEKAAVLIARRKLMTTSTIVKKAGMIFQTEKIVSTSKMRFTNNRLTGLQTEKTWLGLSTLNRVLQNYD